MSRPRFFIVFCHPRHFWVFFCTRTSDLLNETSSFLFFLLFFSLPTKEKGSTIEMISTPTAPSRVVRKSSCSSAARHRNSRPRLHPSLPSRHGATPRNRGTARVRTKARAQATKQKRHKQCTCMFHNHQTVSYATGQSMQDMFIRPPAHTHRMKS